MPHGSKRPLTEEEMARRVAREVREGQIVNLGAGMPFPVCEHVPPTLGAMFLIEHGIIGVEGTAQEPYKDRDLMGLGRRPLKIVPGASCFSSVEAFTMLRGGHVDLSVLGAFQVSKKGDLANWLLPGQCPIIGGAMDIVGHVGRLIVMMTHVTKKGEPKILEECTLPVTGYGVANLIVTDLAVIEVTPQGLVLLETAPGYSPEEIQASTGAELSVSSNLSEIAI